MEEMNMNVENTNEVTTEETKEKKGFGLGKVVLGAALAGIAYAGYKFFKGRKAESEEPAATVDIPTGEVVSDNDVPVDDGSDAEEK